MASPILPLAVAIDQEDKRSMGYYYTCALHVNQMCPPIYGPICNLLSLMKGLE